MISNTIYVGGKRKKIGIIPPPNYADVLQWLPGESTDIEVQDSKNNLDVLMVESTCFEFVTGAEEITLSSSGLSITSYEGTSTPSILGSVLSGTVGTLYNVILSDGSHLAFAEGGNSSMVYSSNSTLTGVITIGEVDPENPNYVWAVQDNYHYNIKGGFDLYSENNILVRQPIGTDAQPGYTFEGIRESGNWHNQAETKYKWPISTELYNVDQLFDTPKLYSSPSVANALGYDDFVADYEYKHLWFWDVFSKSPYKFNSIIHATAQDDLEDLAKTLKYVNANEPLIDSEGVIIQDSNANVIYALKEGVK